MSEPSRFAAADGDGLALCYHGVSDCVRSTLLVTSSSLRGQIAALVGHGYEGVTFHVVATESLQRPRFALTFDDAERSVLDHGAPVLTEFGLPGTIFVPVARVGKPGTVSWEDLAALASLGWEIGSHTMSHQLLTRLDDASLEHELRGSRDAIEDALGSPCRSIAYPYGEVDSRVRDAAARAGYTAGCTTSGGLRAADPLCWPRVGINGHDRMLLFRAKTSRAGRALRESRLAGPLSLTGRAVRSVGRGAQRMGSRHT